MDFYSNAQGQLTLQSERRSMEAQFGTRTLMASRINNHAARFVTGNLKWKSIKKIRKDKGLL